MRVPDLAVSCEVPDLGQRALTEPTLVVEILSPGNEAETRENVWAYTTIPTVREILLIRSTRIAAELLRRARTEAGLQTRSRSKPTGRSFWKVSIFRAH
jgi:Uma2 family endonuclease